MGRARSFVASHLGAPLEKAQFAYDIYIITPAPRLIRSVKVLMILRRGVSEGRA
jgi:hypothetical protein